MNLKATLDNYLGKSVRYSEEDNGDGTKQVCDLDTGDCMQSEKEMGLSKERDIKQPPIERLEQKHLEELNNY